MATPRGFVQRAEDFKPGTEHSDDVEEFPPLLHRSQVDALIEAARRRGLTAAVLARRLIGDYLDRPQAWDGR
jgi:hypothetical protein